MWIWTSDKSVDYSYLENIPYSPVANLENIPRSLKFVDVAIEQGRRLSVADKKRAIRIKKFNERKGPGISWKYVLKDLEPIDAPGEWVQVGMIWMLINRGGK